MINTFRYLEKEYLLYFCLYYACDYMSECVRKGKLEHLYHVLPFQTKWPETLLINNFITKSHFYSKKVQKRKFRMYSEIHKSTIDSIGILLEFFIYESARKPEAYFSGIFCICDEWVKWYEERRRQLEKLRLLYMRNAAPNEWRRSQKPTTKLARANGFASEKYRDHPLRTHTYVSWHVENLCFRHIFTERFFIRKKSWVIESTRRGQLS